jgi:hypothetical protein
MALGVVNFEMEQGEDFTAQVVVQDQWMNPLTVKEPMQMDIDDIYGQLILRLQPPAGPEEEEPGLTYSTDVGLIQIHIDKTQSVSIDPGIYRYDLFCSVKDFDEGVYSGPQRLSILKGKFIVNRRVTEMTT